MRGEKVVKYANVVSENERLTMILALGDSNNSIIVNGIGTVHRGLQEDTV